MPFSIKEFSLKMSKFIIKCNIYKNTKKSIENQKLEIRERIAKVDELNSKTVHVEKDGENSTQKKQNIPIHILRQLIKQKKEQVELKRERM